jgi:hypothetical protein
MYLPIITFFVDPGVYSLDTDELVRLFGLDKDEIIELQSIIWNIFNGASVLVLQWDQDSAPPSVEEGLDDANHNSIYLKATAVRPYQINMYNQKIKNRIDIQIVEQDHILTFIYNKIPGTMDWKAEQSEVIPDIKRISTRENREAGGEFFQAGDINQVGEPD